ncbi:ABC transporter substrate-binding protein [Thorsellia kenyensis]|uniref:sn-glycerol-3-phosphate-binding periplasmic protein UgpB n=1 Tax=Thorsellia kenyensis TaxID=1549888 RepID=A0ABV6CB40_9GAMM
MNTTKSIFKLSTLTILCTVGLSPLAHAEDIVLRYALWDRNQLPYEEALARKYEEKNPGVKIEFELTPYKEFFVKLGAASTGGVSPDIFWMNMPNVTQYSKNGIIEPLNAHIASTKFDVTTMLDSSIKAYQYNGEQMTIPRDVDSIAVWYNKKLFDEAGIAYPTNDWTWDDLRNTTKQLHEKLGDKAFPLMMDLSGDGQDSYLNLLYQKGLHITPMGDKPTDIASQEAIWVYEQLQEMMQDGSLPSIEQMSELKTEEAFQSDRVALAYAGSWLAGPFANNEIINKHVGVVMMPKIDIQASVSHSVSYAISSASKQKEAAWQYISYLASEEAQSQLGTSAIPANKNASKVWAESIKTVDVSPYIETLQFSKAYPVAGTNNPKWQNLWLSALKKIFLGSDATKEMSKVIEKIEKTMGQ